MKNEIAIFKSLSDSTRLNIIEVLLGGEECVCDIFPKVKRTQSTVSIQLAKLESVGLISSRRDGKHVYYSIKNQSICKILRAVGNKKALKLKENRCKRKKKEE